MSYYTTLRGTATITPALAGELLAQLAAGAFSVDAYSLYYFPWIASTNGARLEVWDEEMRYRDAAKQLHALLLLLASHGHRVDGQFMWQGEEHKDLGIIDIANSVATLRYGVIGYRDPVPLRGDEGNFRPNG